MDEEGSPGDRDATGRGRRCLRVWAVDEDLKQTVMSSPLPAAVAAKIARRCSAGETVDDALAAARRGMARGHLVSPEYAGESVRSAEPAQDDGQRVHPLKPSQRPGRGPRR